MHKNRLEVCLHINSWWSRNDGMMGNFFIPIFTDGEVEAQSSAAAKSLQSCLTLCDPIDSSPPGSPVPGFLQARTLE